MTELVSIRLNHRTLLKDDVQTTDRILLQVLAQNLPAAVFGQALTEYLQVPQNRPAHIHSICLPDSNIIVKTENQFN